MIRKGKHLRKGFSSGTAVTAAAIGALKTLLHCQELNKKENFPVSVLLPIGMYLPVMVNVKYVDHFSRVAVAEVKKDGGDDPDVTHEAIFRVGVSLHTSSNGCNGIYLKACEGVGVVTREGLPLNIGEPAINPVPRFMLRDNIERIFSQYCGNCPFDVYPQSEYVLSKERGGVFIPFANMNIFQGIMNIEISVPDGDSLARKTLNPRLGIVGGLSILGTTGLVIPYSHEAFRETIVSALQFARANGCDVVVLSTGGKSEKFARREFPCFSDAAFVQIADFYKFSLEKVSEFGISRVIHAVFFGKLVKMAMGFPYTHAHVSTLDLQHFINTHGRYFPSHLQDSIASANTARQVLDVLKALERYDIIEWIVEWALEQSRRFSPRLSSIGLVLFDYDGSVLWRKIPV